MKANLEVHPVQAKALRVLLFQTEARFRELNVDKISTDKFNFHLKSLVDAGILEKKNEKYILTNKGKEFANRFDTEKVVIERQAKLTLGVVPMKTVSGKKYFLLHQRLKQPYYGYLGTVNGKIRWGEKVFEAAKRELFEETGLSAEKMLFLGVHHKMDFSEEGKLLEDKYFFRVRVEHFTGKLKDVPEGKNKWYTIEDVKDTEKIFPDLVEALEIYGENEIIFTEHDYLAEGY